MALTDVSARAAKAKDKVYRLADGGSLFLKVMPGGSKSWEFRYKLAGVVKTAVLGSFPEPMGLKAARDERDRMRVQLRETGIDPGTEKRAAVAAVKLETEERIVQLAKVRAERAERAERERAAKLAAATAAKANMSVESLVRIWEKHKQLEWSERSREQITAHMQKYVVNVIGRKSLASLHVDDVFKVIDPIIAAGKVETARRVRQKFNDLLNFALTRDKVSKNVVALAAADLKTRFKRAHLAHPEQQHPTIPMKELPELLRAMRAYDGTATSPTSFNTSRALLWFLALTGCRTGEARFATWKEFDEKAGTWTLSAERMKAKRGHTVYLSPAALALFKELRLANGHRDFVFPHPRRDDRPCSENASLYVLAAIGYKDRMTGHGFRHLFSTAANESGLFRPDVIEAALAHGDPDKIRATYNGAKYVEERRKLSAWWATYLAAAEREKKVLAFKRKA